MFTGKNRKFLKSIYIPKKMFIYKIINIICFLFLVLHTGIPRTVLLRVIFVREVHDIVRVVIAYRVVTTHGRTERHGTVLWVIVACVWHVVRGMWIQGTVVLVISRWSYPLTTNRTANSCTRTEDWRGCAGCVVRGWVFCRTPYWVHVVGGCLCRGKCFVVRAFRGRIGDIIDFGTERGCGGNRGLR